MKKTLWIDRLSDIQSMMDDRVSLEAIGLHYGVSKQRIYQVLQKYNLNTPVAMRKSFLKGKPPKVHWLNRMLTLKQVDRSIRVRLLNTMLIPDHCPALGIELNYDGTAEGSGWTRTDNSPSIDQIVPSAGYIEGNMQILSWRANRIKNDSSPEELRLLADYMDTLD